MSVNMDPNNRLENNNTSTKKPEGEKDRLYRIVNSWNGLLEKSILIDEKSFRGYCIHRQNLNDKNLSFEEQIRVNACVEEQRQFHKVFLEWNNHT